MHDVAVQARQQLPLNDLNIKEHAIVGLSKEKEKKPSGARQQLQQLQPHA